VHPGARLNVNQVQAVVRLLSHLAAPASAASPADTAFLDKARRTGTLPLVTAGAQLVPARQAAFVAPGTGSRLLGRVDPAALTLAHPQLPESVCRWLGVPALHEVVLEVLDSSVALQEVVALRGGSRAAVSALLTSRELSAAVYSQVQAYSSVVPSLKALTLAQVEEKLQVGVGVAVWRGGCCGTRGTGAANHTRMSTCSGLLCAACTD
jgi:sacsin